MSLRGACEVRTICEVLREILDEAQGSAILPKILPKLIEAESMAKRMSKKLIEYNKEVYAGWWEKNPNYAEDMERRLNQSYIVGDKT